jgi:hypothetical protein
VNSDKEKKGKGKRVGKKLKPSPGHDWLILHDFMLWLYASHSYLLYSTWSDHVIVLLPFMLLKGCGVGMDSHT